MPLHPGSGPLPSIWTRHSPCGINRPQQTTARVRCNSTGARGVTSECAGVDTAVGTCHPNAHPEGTGVTEPTQRMPCRAKGGGPGRTTPSPMALGCPLRGDIQSAWSTRRDPDTTAKSYNYCDATANRHGHAVASGFAFSRSAVTHRRCLCRHDCLYEPPLCPPGPVCPGAGTRSPHRRS